MSIHLPPTPPNPWKKLGTRRVYTNPWMEVFEDDVIRPDGTNGVYGKTVFGKSIATVVLRPDGNMLLVGQWRYLLDQYTWEVPTGGCNKGEVPLDAAKRELLEEAGITAKQWTPLGTITIPHIIDEGHLFLVEVITEGAQQTESIEALQKHWLPFTDALQLVDDGVITGWMSQVPILRAARFLARRK